MQGNMKKKNSFKRLLLFRGKFIVDMLNYKRGIIIGKAENLNYVVICYEGDFLKAAP